MKRLLILPALAALTACGSTKKSVVESAALTDSTHYAHVAYERREAAVVFSDSAAWEADSAEVLEVCRPDGTVTTRLRALRLRSVRTHAAAGIARQESTDSVSSSRNIKTETARTESVQTLKPWGGWYAVAAVALLVMAIIIIVKLI